MKKRVIFKIIVWIAVGVVISDLAYRYGFELLEIPTSSMEKSIYAGEYVLVNKLIPGPRFFSNNPEKYRRWRVNREPRYNEVVVFNFPEADTVLANRPGESYYLLKRQHPNYRDSLKKEFWGETIPLKVNRRPRMLKRLKGLPGDTILIAQGKLFINSRPAVEAGTSVSSWQWRGSHDEFNWFVEQNNIAQTPITRNNRYFLKLSLNEMEEMAAPAELLTRDVMRRGIPDPHVFPFKRNLGWNSDNMGPVYLPRAGETIEINPGNIHFYRRMIEVFENTPIEVKGNYLFSNNIPISRYTFKMNYYWVHGDNRPHSFDSRYWGAVPENHLVGVVMRR
ncbi:S26 family signal peptidase [Natronoflexus pectinivorans]|uniref:Signal peptidase I n=1 Tax=Natronoflexus pectinivorans TaxID=682526 RepID=A0A4R2G720_9BACT|nr:S26 family signal peptidase [Natronoflexus pectinivorans]TCO03291.1 signal peptidase I [Natronoflexus pectinivorans]